MAGTEQDGHLAVTALFTEVQSRKPVRPAEGECLLQRKRATPPQPQSRSESCTSSAQDSLCLQLHATVRGVPPHVCLDGCSTRSARSRQLCLHPCRGPAFREGIVPQLPVGHDCGHPTAQTELRADRGSEVTCV